MKKIAIDSMKDGTLEEENFFFLISFFMGTKCFLIKWFEQAAHSRMNRLTLRHYRQSRARPIYGRETAANCSFATELSLYSARKKGAH